MARPTDLKYSPTHEWVRVDGDVAVLGITDHAVEELGDLAFIDLPKPGAAVKKGERFGEIESTKAVSDLISPVTGEILEVNEELVDDLERISLSPFDRGWMIRVRMSRPADLSDLLSAEDYAAKISTEEH
jgi:glycine cleavage system H protein